jgi:hypothetical protein
MMRSARPAQSRVQPENDCFIDNLVGQRTRNPVITRERFREILKQIAGRDIW